MCGRGHEADVRGLRPQRPQLGMRDGRSLTVMRGCGVAHLVDRMFQVQAAQRPIGC
jgi:hypothetical protein